VFKGLTDLLETCMSHLPPVQHPDSLQTVSTGVTSML